MKPATTTTRDAIFENKGQFTKKTLAAYRKAHSNFRLSARKCAVKYRLNMRCDMQIAGNGKLSAMCQGSNKVFGSSVMKTVPIKSVQVNIITHQKNRLTKHYQTFYSKKSRNTNIAIESSTRLSMISKFNVSSSTKELGRVIDLLARVE